MKDVTGWSDGIAGIKQWSLSQFGCRGESEGQRLVAGDLAVLARCQLGWGNAVVNPKGPGGGSVVLATL